MMRHPAGRVAVASLFGLLGLADLSQAQSLLGEHKDWQAWRVEEADGPTCFITSASIQDPNNQAEEEAARIYVTHRAWHDETGIVSINPAKDLREDTVFEARIGSRAFEMEAVDTDHAWLHQGNDRDLVAAMIAGIELSFSAYSASGDAMMHLFSLRGFTAAYREINRACSAR